VRVLGRRLRLAGAGGTTSTGFPSSHHDRWARHPLLPRSLAASRRDPAAPQPRCGSVVEFQCHRAHDPIPPPHDGDVATVPRRRAVASGYGFSDKPTEAGWNLERIAAPGPGYGAARVRPLPSRRAGMGRDGDAHLAGRDADHLIGVHLNMPLAPPTSASADRGGAGRDRIVGPRTTSTIRVRQLQGSRPVDRSGYGPCRFAGVPSRVDRRQDLDWADHAHDIVAVLDRDRSRQRGCSTG